MMKIQMSLASCLVGAAISSAAYAQATELQESVGESSGWHGRVGAGGAVVPQYQGGKTMIVTPLPYLDLRYRFERLGTVALGTDGLSWSALESENFSAGLLLGYDAGRKEHTVGLRSSKSIERLKGMGTLDTTVMYGAFGSMAVGPARLTAKVLKAPGDHGNGGALGHLSLDQSMPLGQWVVSVSPGVTFSDHDYAVSYFGVSVTQAQRSGLPRYAPRSGIQSVGLTIAAQYPINERWSLTAVAGADRLVRDAAHSPIVERAIQPTAAVFVSHGF